MPASVIKSETFVQRVRMQSKLQIPAACDEFVIYKELKHGLQDSYSLCPWFWVDFRGLGTQIWNLDAWFHIGASIIHQKFRRKLRTQVINI